MRRLVAVAGTALALAWATTPAWGHAGLQGPSQAMADTDHTMTLEVPEERGPDLHNTKVAVEVPAGFTVNGCEAPQGWTCSTDPSPADGASIVRFSGAGAGETFRLDVHTPSTPGDYTFKVSQTYTDGNVVVWDGTSDRPAPVLTVVAGDEHPGGDGDHEHPGMGGDMRPCSPEGTSLVISAHHNEFDKDCLAVLAGVPFTIALTSQDSEPHNVVIHDHDTPDQHLFRGELFTGPKTVIYSVGPLPAGTYHFHCEAHPTMAGTFVVAADHAAAPPPTEMPHPPAVTAPAPTPAPTPPVTVPSPPTEVETSAPRSAVGVTAPASAAPSPAEAATVAAQLPRTGSGRNLLSLAGLVISMGGLATIAGARRPLAHR